MEPRIDLMASELGAVALVALINAANRFGVIARNQGGSYEAGMFTSRPA